MNLGKNVLTDSAVIVYDANIIKPDENDKERNQKRISVRDMVALDEYKVSRPKSKFDFQILEPGDTFVTYMEQNCEDERDVKVIDEIARAWESGRIRIGAKTGRGYGKTKTVEIKQAVFNFNPENGSDGNDIEKWLNFDMYGESDWGNPEYSEADDSILEKKEIFTIKLGLRQDGAISIRQYSGQSEDPDYSQMKRLDGKPVIPGTSWAGAFRAQMEKLDRDFSRNSELSELFFGSVKKNDENVDCKEKKDEETADSSHRSRIVFSESVLEAPEGQELTWINYTRNAIDRFSGGTIDKALYTERTCYHGDTDLEINCDMTGIEPEQASRFKKVLAAAILDLHNGYMAVGGLTSVGHGLFKVKEITVDGGEGVKTITLSSDRGTFEVKGKDGVETEGKINTNLYQTLIGIQGVKERETEDECH